MEATPLESNGEDEKGRGAKAFIVLTLYPSHAPASVADAAATVDRSSALWVNGNCSGGTQPAADVPPPMVSARKKKGRSEERP